MAEPLDRFESIIFRYHHADWATTLRIEPFSIQFVTENHWRQTGRIFENASDWQRTAKHLLGVVVVVTMVKNTPQLILGLSQPDNIAQGYAFPQPHAKRAPQIQTRHDLGKTDGLLFT